jgi:hypothetical protein
MDRTKRLPLAASGTVAVLAMATFIWLRGNHDVLHLTLWVVSPQLPVLILVWLSRDRGIRILATAVLTLFWLSAVLHLTLKGGGASGVFLPLLQWSVLLAGFVILALLGGVVLIIEFLRRFSRSG